MHDLINTLHNWKQYIIFSASTSQNFTLFFYYIYWNFPVLLKYITGFPSAWDLSHASVAAIMNLCRATWIQSVTDFPSEIIIIISKWWLFGFHIIY